MPGSVSFIDPTLGTFPRKHFERQVIRVAVLAPGRDAARQVGCVLEHASAHCSWISISPDLAREEFLSFFSSLPGRRGKTMSVLFSPSSVIAHY